MHLVAELQRPLIEPSSRQMHDLFEYDKKTHLEIFLILPKYADRDAFPWAMSQPDSIKSGCGIGARGCVLF
jgi:hypothetical protein